MDALIASPARLKILLALAGGSAAPFADLRRATALTDGNLASHARRLNSGGLVQIDKYFREGKPRTEYRLTPQGLTALQRHVESLRSAMNPAEPLAVEEAQVEEEQWVD